MSVRVAVLQLEPQVAASAICESPRPRPGTNYFKRSGGMINNSATSRDTAEFLREKALHSAATSRHQQQCCDIATSATVLRHQRDATTGARKSQRCSATTTEAVKLVRPNSEILSQYDLVDNYELP